MSEEKKDIIMTEPNETLAEDEKEQKVEMSEVEMGCGGKKEELADDNKEMACGEKEMACGEKDMSEADKIEEKDDETVDKDVKDMSEADKIEEKDDEDVDDEEKDMSFSGTFKLSEFSENKADEIKAFCEMSSKEVVEKLIEMSDEISSLKKFKEETDAKEKFAKLSSIMASVKNDLNDDDYKKFSEEGEKLSLSELNGFENKVKAFAYENSKKNDNKNDNGIMTFAGVESSMSEKKEMTADDIFNKYL